MPNLTAKELSSLEDQLSAEQGVEELGLVSKMIALDVLAVFLHGDDLIKIDLDIFVTNNL